MFTSRVGFDETIQGPSVFAWNEAVTSGFTSEQTEKCASRRLISGFKRYDGAAPRNAADESLTATYTNARLLLKRLGQ